MPSLIGQSFLVKDILSLDSEQVSALKYDLIAQKINLSRLGELIKSAESPAEIDFAFNQVLDMAASDPSLGESFFYGHTKDNMVIYTPHMFSIEASFGRGIAAASREEFVPNAKAAFFKEATTVDTTEKLLDIIQKEQAATEEVLQDVTEIVLRSSRAANIEVEVEVGVEAGVEVRPDQASAPAGKITEFKDEYRFLSNFWPSPIVVEDKRYPTVEHFYQAMKSPDLAERARIAALPSPGDAKRAGARLEKLRTDWDEVKLGVMEEGLKLKFQIPALKEKLLATGNKTIEEGNTWNDAFWGIDLKKQQGENHLGKLLMKVRDELRLEADLKNKGAAHPVDIPMRRRVVKPG